MLCHPSYDRTTEKYIKNSLRGIRARTGTWVKDVLLDLVICFHGLSRDTRNGEQMVYVLSVLVCCGEAFSFLSKFEF